ncbi:hypothetical protein BJF85_14590 [Saccharomonospora sp. CUA-673]|nr:hypothetical protein BJF85_14590 [Saccharomonospora sp. CUA-673]
MTEDAGSAGGNVWDKFTFAITGAKGTATEHGWLKDTTSVGTGVVGAGGFKLDPESAESMVKKARWIADQKLQQVEEARELAYTQPPAKDPGSVNFTKVAVASFEVGARYVDHSHRFHTELAEKLAKALDVYKGTDEQSRNDVNDSGGGVIE